MDRTALRDPWQDARDILRDRILSGTLRPGERILEVPLAADLGVSRGPVREALRALAGEGLVVREPRLGSIVVPIDQQTADEVYTLRGALEVFALKRAFAREENDLALDLWVPLERMRDALRQGRPERIVEPDLAFHAAIVAAAGHARLLQTWEGLVGPLRILVGLTAHWGSQEDETSLLRHEELYGRIEADDLDGAIARLEAHLEAARTMVLAYLDETAPAARAPKVVKVP